MIDCLPHIPCPGRFLRNPPYRPSRHSLAVRRARTFLITLLSRTNHSLSPLQSGLSIPLSMDGERTLLHSSITFTPRGYIRSASDSRKKEFECSSSDSCMEEIREEVKQRISHSKCARTHKHRLLDRFLVRGYDKTWNITWNRHNRMRLRHGFRKK